MTDTIHKYAVDPGGDGKFYLLEGRSVSEVLPGMMADRHKVGTEVIAFESDAAAREYARKNLGAKDKDFADNPGTP